MFKQMLDDEVECCALRYGVRCRSTRDEPIEILAPLLFRTGSAPSVAARLPRSVREARRRRPPTKSPMKPRAPAQRPSLTRGCAPGWRLLPRLGWGEETSVDDDRETPGRLHSAVPGLVQEAFSGPRIFELYREMAEKLKPPEPIYVRIKAPPSWLGPDAIRPAHHHRRGPHRRDVHRRCRLLIRAEWTKLAE
jgi:hypothetical protein